MASNHQSQLQQHQEHNYREPHDSWLHIHMEKEYLKVEYCNRKMILHFRIQVSLSVTREKIILENLMGYEITISMWYFYSFSLILIISIIMILLLVALSLINQLDLNKGPDGTHVRLKLQASLLREQFKILTFSCVADPSMC